MHLLYGRCIFLLVIIFIRKLNLLEGKYDGCGMFDWWGCLIGWDSDGIAGRDMCASNVKNDNWYFNISMLLQFCRLHNVQCLIRPR